MVFNSEIMLGYDFCDNIKKALSICSSDELNGWYNYTSKLSVINVTSDDFKKKKTFNAFSRLFSKIATHEAVHHAISECLGNDDVLKGEERVVELMSGERNFRK